MTRIIAISNEKGGVAKTTTAISLGGALTELGKEVLLIDLDPQANLSLAMGITPQKVRRSIAEVFLNSVPPQRISIETSIPGLDIIPSNSELGIAERFLTVRKDYKSILRSALESMPIYDIIILDCPPSMSAVTLNALVAANLVIIPTQAEYFSTYALKNVISTVNSIRANETPELTFRILITMFDVRIKSHQSLSTQIRAAFKYSIFDSYIQIDTKFRDSTIIGLPITHYVPKSRGASQYRSLAQELIQYVPAEQDKQSA